MSLPTVPAFIHTGPWSAQTRAHPAMVWMESYTRTAIDNRSWTTGTPASEWHTADFTLQKSDGTVIRGGEAAWHEGIAVIYGPFTPHLHSPNFLVCSETEDGWQMIGQADMYASLPGEGSGERVRDGEGRVGFDGPVGVLVRVCEGGGGEAWWDIIEEYEDLWGYGAGDEGDGAEGDGDEGGSGVLNWELR